MRLGGSRQARSIQMKGASVVVVKEGGAGGRVFGGYADTSWTDGPKFFGGNKCFVFRLAEAGETGLGGEPVHQVEIYRDVGRSGNRLYLHAGENPSFPRCLAFGATEQQNKLGSAGGRNNGGDSKQMD